MKVALIGNPNCGKTTIFNALTGSQQRIGNWPGVTVEKKAGWFQYKNHKMEIVDLPGIYSFDDEISDDEKVAKEYILSGDADVFVNIIDSTHFERNLYLTMLLLEMGIPMIVLLNMKDLADKDGVTIDPSALQHILSVPVLSIKGIDKADIVKVKELIIQASTMNCTSTPHIQFRNSIEKVLTQWSKILKGNTKKSAVNPRWVALDLLLENSNVKKLPPSVLQELQPRIEIERLKEEWNEEVDVLVAEDVYSTIHEVAAKVRKKTASKRSFSETFDSMVLNKWLGIPFFLGVMYLLFWVVQQFAGAFIDFFDILADTLFLTGLGRLLETLGSPHWLTTFLAHGIGGGIQTVATFIPLVFVLFFFLSLLESSGYMSRAAFVADRFMQKIGLPGKAFVPMMVGFGCTVPAIMATRTLETKKDRYMTIFMAPLMSCGARLPVYILFAAAFFPSYQGLIVFSLYLAGILIAVGTGLFLKSTLFKGEASTFVMELPPYHTPKFSTMLKSAWSRTSIFIKRAGIVIVIVMTILGFLNSFEVSTGVETAQKNATGIESSSNEPQQQTALAVVGKAITPIFMPMGVEKENWPASVGILTGLFAKEAVVGTLGGVYAQLESQGSDTALEESPTEEWSFWGGIGDAFATIPENISAAFSAFKDVMGFSDVGGSKEEIADVLESDMGLFQQLQKRFTKGPWQAYAYLLFILIYFPCIAVLGVIKKEAGLLITYLSVGYLTVIAWIIATLFYQITIGHTLLWIVVPLAMSFGLYILFSRLRSKVLI
ncbi:MAG: ferrous iron transport protein B [Caldisericia bacterium]|nr:ferrous iron transport protein B [Caldisericia bacterium]